MSELQDPPLRLAAKEIAPGEPLLCGSCRDEAKLAAVTAERDRLKEREAHFARPPRSERGASMANDRTTKQIARDALNDAKAEGVVRDFAVREWRASHDLPGTREW